MNHSTILSRLAILTCALAVPCLAQTDSAVLPERPPAPGAGYGIVERGPHHRVWERVELVPAYDGRVVERRHRYEELATGMHFQNERGEWEESEEKIEILPGGAGAVAARGRHKAVFPPEIKSGLIEMQTPDGRWLRSRVWGLAYFDASSGESVLLAEVKESEGRLAGDNVVVYPDALTGFAADVRYTYTRAGFEQDVVLRQNPPSPEQFGLNPRTTRLQVLTEFVEAPDPTVTPGQAGELADSTLGFGETSIGLGKAFSVGADGQSGEEVPVGKQWGRLEGRDFLIEEVPHEKVAEKLRKLPASPAYEGASLRRRGKGETSLAALRGLLPARFAVAPPPPAKAGRFARAERHSGPGFVMDYVALGSSLTNHVFKGDTTYYISGMVMLSGTNTTFEGGTVIKYDKAISTPLIAQSPSFLNWQSGDYRPVIFTAKDDNSVGETISGSTGSPTGYYAAPVLGFNYGGNGNLSHFRISYANTGIYFLGGGYTNSISDAQFVNCNVGVVVAYQQGVNVRNVLFSQVVADFSMLMAGNSSVNAQNTTFAGGGWLINNNSGASSLACVNCVFANVTNLAAYPSSLTLSGTNNGFYNSFGGSTFGTSPVTASGYPFQSVGGGNYYLTNGSPFRNVGTTNIDAGLLAGIQTKTTYPPVTCTNQTFSTPTTFSPQAPRDTDTPDLGYHYDALDYSMGGCAATTNITFSPGTAVGWFRTSSGWYHAGQAIRMVGDIAVAFEGTAAAPCYFVRLNTVQENDRTAGYGHGGIENWEQPRVPIVRGRFLRCTAMAGESFNGYFADDYGLIRAEMTHSEFWSGSMQTYGDWMMFTNCLMWRLGYVGVVNGYSGCSFAMRNCTMIGGRLAMQRNSSGANPVSVRDCSFDGTTFQLADYYGANPAYTDYDYNAYTNVANPFPVGGGQDIIVTTFNWQSGSLGKWYLPGGSPLIGQGGVPADVAGLYHFTTLTDQTKEANSTVDIGFHYVATGANGLPMDTDGDTLFDYAEDADGGGTLTGSDGSSWLLSDTDSDGMSDSQELVRGRSPRVSGQRDGTAKIGLRIYSPLH
jgi:hypothetical protein